MLLQFLCAKHGLARDFLMWKDNSISIVASSSGQNKDLTNSEEERMAAYSAQKSRALL